MRKRLIPAVLAIVLAPAVLLAQKVSYDYNKSANFASFKTYAQKDGTKVGQPLIDDRIAEAIDTELAAKGLKKVESDPDVVVVYHVAFDQEKDISTFSSGWGGGWGGGTTSTQVRNILIGTLVIDIADAKSKTMAWRGMATKEVSQQTNPEKRDKNINNAVKKVFKNYPPKVKTT
jgi:hypothetical protein